MEKIKNQVHTCFHCGNKSIMKYIGNTCWESVEEVKNDNGIVIHVSLLEQEYWHVFECPVCNKPVLISEYVYPMDDYPSDVRIEYPVIAVSAEGVPEEIYSAFEAAVRTKGIDRAICLLSLRRVLEMICKDKNANGNTLEKMIEDLINKKVFPPMIENACWIIRKLGNVAAHADKTYVYQSELDQVIGYVATIIDYLYSLPHRVGKLKIKVEQRCGR